MKVAIRTLMAVVLTATAIAADEPLDRVTPRPPISIVDRDRWLENMVGWHHFSVAEASMATGLPAVQVERSLAERKIRPRGWNAKKVDEPMRILPYPGGRHPRIGFRDGAIDPQRETKVSVFPPWKDGGYIVVDFPEAIFSNLGLTYLAHAHVPTIWSKQNVALEPLEWQATPKGELFLARKLPNGIEFSTKVTPSPQSVDFAMTLSNGTAATLTGLRVQVCLMLKMASGFEAQTNGNKRFIGDFAVCHDATSKRWIIASFRPKHRTWGNPPCPCLHADPKFPDTPPGKISRVLGRIAFFEGENIDAEVARLLPTWSRALDTDR